nr:hypothetical protein [Mycobacterium sp.]
MNKIFGGSLSGPNDEHTTSGPPDRLDVAARCPGVINHRAVRAVAPLRRPLRGEVLDQLAEENRTIAAGADENEQPFHGLGSDWRTGTE